MSPSLLAFFVGFCLAVTPGLIIYLTGVFVDGWGWGWPLPEAADDFRRLFSRKR